MGSSVKIAGHPVHPMLVVLPLGLFISSLVFDIIYLINGEPAFAVVAYWNIAAGIFGGLLAALFGTLDFLSIPKGTRAKGTGLWHGVGNVMVVVMFFISWLLRREVSGFEPPTIAVLFSAGGLLLGTITAWLGGELVYRLGIGVDKGAHPNAPSSLTVEEESIQARGAGGMVPVTGEDEEHDSEERVGE